MTRLNKWKYLKNTVTPGQRHLYHRFDAHESRFSYGGAAKDRSPLFYEDFVYIVTRSKASLKLIVAGNTFRHLANNLALTDVADSLGDKLQPI